MSLIVTLSDHAAKIVQAHLSEYDSVEAFVESAIARMEGQEQDDPKYTEYLRQALAEGMEGPMMVWDPEEFIRECMEEFAKEKCQTSGQEPRPTQWDGCLAALSDAHAHGEVPSDFLDAKMRNQWALCQSTSVAG